MIIVTKQKLAETIAAFEISTTELKSIAAALRYDIEKGLAGSDESSLAMLPGYVGQATGKEKGRFLALDFGGTNVRAECVELLGDGTLRHGKKVARPLIKPGEYDYTKAPATAEQLFDFLAEIIAEAAPEGNAPIRLGHTFSFGTTQTELGRARLIHWTKEFAVPGVEGQEVTALLEAALARRGLSHIKPVAVINDTTAVLLAASLSGRRVGLGSIYATGHNTCSLEYFADGRPPMIYNLESGGFSKLMPNKYDTIVDRRSEKPWEQRLEKMVSGRYLGELFKVACEDMLGITMLAQTITSADLAEMEKGDLDFANDLTGKCVSGGIGKAMAGLATAVLQRSARIVAATYAGILWHQAKGGEIAPQQLAIDGSLYQHVPTVRQALDRALSELLGAEAGKIEIVHCNGASCVGAAVAAALAE